ncbi:MAG: hypothetical protein K1X88_09025 [Nannocystaceae bacterium]|nr:hypothetical protein [Nannocystaceae bacterium]
MTHESLARCTKTVALALALVGGCQNKPADTAATAGKAAAAGKTADAGAAKTPPPLDSGASKSGGRVFEAKTGAEPTEAKAEAKAEASADLGQRFLDPAWFRKDMLEGAKATDVSRSERNEKGLFSSQILFDLAAGTTAEQCADQLQEKVGKDVTNLVRAPDEKLPGRLKLTGSTQRYRVTMMCGEAKGVMRAYVSFEWLE